MYTALNSTSRTLQSVLEREFRADANLAAYFNPGAAGAMVVSLNTPREMQERAIEGISVWLYRVMRDDQRLNSPAVRVSETQVRRTPLPVRLHYLITPIVNSTETVYGPELEQIFLGKVLEVFYDHPNQHGSALQGDFTGTSIEFYIRLESLNLEEITRVWDALERSYQLSVSYEVTVIEIESALRPRIETPVREVLIEHGVIVGGE